MTATRCAQAQPAKGQMTGPSKNRAEVLRTNSDKKETRGFTEVVTHGPRDLVEISWPVPDDRMPAENPDVFVTIRGGAKTNQLTGMKMSDLEAFMWDLIHAIETTRESGVLLPPPLRLVATNRGA